ncbi:transposase [Nostoc linckia z18]|uniref:Transposase n=2 Tax=Nostoc linckia TaxID=92942 RepID=A0ABX4KGL3_NOSLI|nr:transposase [Nostoc linckia]PHK39243.1 transposase [Nostoc linckia z15]PHK44333.1 transposase [Nostoc linckia z16]PHJ93443.1 transposase [Nostoc linckia z7]PHK23860.1 transposase [Nostoc linckia z13]PHK31109.1 transposase [Nostoc linckia z18]
MIKILGLDVSKSSVSACLLTQKPEQPRQFYYECPFYRFSANAEGIKALLGLDADIAMIEPTGNNYSKLWGTHLARAGVEVRLIGHKELKNYRDSHLGLPDKDDDADALALACYYFDYHTEPRRFVQIRDQTIVKIRELVLRLAHLNRVQSPIINRARQDLAWQFPEVAHVRSLRGESGEVPLLWGWLAGERKSTRYDRLYAQTAGLGITETVRQHAKRICNLQREEHAIEGELRELLGDSRFEPYRQVFKKFGFGDRLSSVLISQIFPIEGFLDASGRPEVRIRQGRNSKKPTKRHLSLRRFQKALGAAPSLVASGDSKKTKVVGGSDLCRKALWQWVYTRIEPKRSRLKNDIGQQLGSQLDAEKASGRPAKLIRNRIAAKAARLLFRELVKGLV